MESWLQGLDIEGFNVTTIFLFVVPLCSLFVGTIFSHGKQVVFLSHLAKNMASGSCKISFPPLGVSSLVAPEGKPWAIDCDCPSLSHTPSLDRLQ